MRALNIGFLIVFFIKNEQSVCNKYHLSKKIVQIFVIIPLIIIEKRCIMCLLKEKQKQNPKEKRKING